MRGLTILVATGDPERLHAALCYAAAGAAMGGKVRVHLHEGAVRLAHAPQAAPSDPQRRAAGLPTLPQIWDEVLALDVALSVCQSGLALAGIGLDQLDARIEAQGPVGFLSGSEDDRLVVF